jgi:hypothetical protein
VLDEEYVRRARASGDPRRIAFGLDLIQFHAAEDGRLEDALEAAVEGLRMRTDLGEVQNQLDSLSRVARVRSRMGHMETAALLLSSSLHLHEERGMGVPLYQEKRKEEILALVHAELDESAIAQAWERGRKLTLDEAVARALEGTDEPRA